jgi:hypothetical protein
MAPAGAIISDRECGSCTACCKFAPIKHELLHKPTNTLCPHCLNGCQVYAMRPDVCRDWNCGWRIVPAIPHDWRPDRSGVVFRVEDLRESEITVTILDESRAVQSDAFASLIAEWIEAGIRVFFQTVGPAGHYPTHVFVNPMLVGLARSPAAMRLVFNEMLASLAAQHEWEPDRIELRSSILESWTR